MSNFFSLLGIGAMQVTIVTDSAKSHAPPPFSGSDHSSRSNSSRQCRWSEASEGGSSGQSPPRDPHCGRARAASPPVHPRRSKMLPRLNSNSRLGPFELDHSSELSPVGSTSGGSDSSSSTSPCNVPAVMRRFPSNAPRSASRWNVEPHQTSPEQMKIRKSLSLRRLPTHPLHDNASSPQAAAAKAPTPPRPCRGPCRKPRRWESDSNLGSSPSRGNSKSPPPTGRSLVMPYRIPSVDKKKELPFAPPPRKKS